MIPLTFNDVQMLIAAALFVLGILGILIGIFVLVSRGQNKEIHTLAAHTARLGRKGISSEVTGLVSSASELLGALNQLVRTATGVGVFLVTFGMSLLAASYWVLMQVSWAG